MKKFGLLLVPLLLASLTGCARNYYNIPNATFTEKVRTLGVLPIMVDAGSDLGHPQKDAVVQLVKEANRKNERAFVSKLKENGGYLSVQFIEGDADKQFDALFFRREFRDDAGIVYNKYFFKQQELRDLMTSGNLDAVMIMIVSGITKKDKMRSSNLVSYLDADYNYLILTAQIVDSQGTILWEYPNFRQQAPDHPPLYALQYPDFDEAAANLDDRVSVKYRTPEGIRRGMTKTGKDVLLRETGVAKPYMDAFDDMMSLLRVQGAPAASGTAKLDAPK